MSDVNIVVMTDADNTLWDTDRVYADAQLHMLDEVEESIKIPANVNDRLSYLREVDQEIASIHHKGLRYPPALLAIALEQRLKGKSAYEAAKIAVRLGVENATVPAKELEKHFLENLSKIPPLRTGVTVGLRDIKRIANKVFVVTEGDRELCNHRLKHYGLEKWVDKIIEGKKRPELYNRVKGLVKDVALYFMIGDQLDRDIEPATQSGFTTIYFAGGFNPKWHPEEETVSTDFRINAFNEIPNILLTKIKKNELENYKYLHS